MSTGEPTLRIGQAAELLGVGVETLRRWEEDGQLRAVRSVGGQRLVPLGEVSRLLGERRQAAGEQRQAAGEQRTVGRRPATREPRIVAQSARNRFAGVVTRIERDTVAAVVEVMAGPHRLVSLMTAEAVEDMGLQVGDKAICVVKATNVIVEIPG
ncbi:MAG TPA: TOBE domain-containing protein [Candidatus Nanopelagicales bacterium]|nr:TOBE domain-containing protein [Candidatus Nanopelagicales bacterium]